KNLKRFTEKMNKVKLVGKFTVLGREQGKLPTEEYTINSVKKLPRGDYWQFNARIKYGGVDAPMSFPLEVKWSGDTPVITLTKLKIPALGTFSARVLLYNNKYAGTWTHGNAGGHMFGVIEPVKEEEAEKKTDEAN
ncbi:MAG: hypothetical protein QGF59_32325, partial [Pirellulaceae bacterium]|nr:hypothetical protein [Pirellulaceae bacterium]